MSKATSNWLTPGQKHQRQSARLSLCASLIWPFQAWLVAYALGGLLTGVHVAAFQIAMGFIALGGARTVLSHMSEKLGERAAICDIQTARAHIVKREAERAEDCTFGGAGSIAALAGEKLDLLAPFITRYAPAKARVMVVPLVILCVAFWNSWAVGIIFLISGPLIPVFMALVGMAAKEASRTQMAEVGTLNDLLVERLSALVDIRLLGARDAVISEFEHQAQGLRQRTMAVLRVAFLSSTILELFAAIGVAMVAVYVGFSLLGMLNFGAWGGTLAPEVGIFLLLLAPEFYQPLRDLASAWHDKASADAVLDELTTWDDAQTPTLMGQGGPGAAMGGAASVSLSDCALPGGNTLQSLDILPGETVALMGASGVGKTSTLRLIAGLQEPSGGAVIVAGKRLDATTADAWRARVGWMPQTPHFLNASLRHNLTFGRAGDLAKALEDAAVADVVAALPQGLQTRLGETGGGLSGGEARRLTLARAIYGSPDIILADEPTADLDAETAAAVTEGLMAQALRGVTLIVATHDAKLAAKMDRIIEIGAQS